jgi:anti-sigma factor RsiW
MKLTDEQIVAYADGELPADEAEMVKQAIEQDDAAAERLKMYVESRELLKKEFAHILSDPVPDHLEAVVKEHMTSIDGSKISQFFQSRAFQTIAASLMVAVFVGGMFELLVNKGGQSVLPPNSAVQSQMPGTDDTPGSYLNSSSDSYAHKVSVLLAQKLQEDDTKQEYEIKIDGTSV